MKDTPKKLGAVALAGVMVAGGTLQSGTVVANAEGNNRANTSASTMSDVDISTFDSLYAKIKEWGDVWTSDLRDVKNKRNPNYKRNMYFRSIYGQLNKYRNKIDILGLGSKMIVDTIYDTADFLLRDDFGFNPIKAHYNTVEELITGKVSNDERVVNLGGKGPKDYGGVPIHKFQKGKFYKITIGDYMKITDDRPICHIFLYVKN